MPKLGRIHVLALLSWAVFLVWWLLMPNTSAQLKADKATEKAINRAAKAVQLFKKQNGSYPISLTELKAFARSLNFNLSLYDGFGHALEYISLNRDNYLIRSFGQDGGQNTLLLNKDQSGSNLKALPDVTPMLKYWPKPEISYYPPSLVAGSNSPNKEWHARLFYNFNDGKKKLVVQHRKKKAFFMVARHDAIEEFMWLPSGYGIIFTATSSQRYRDGVFYWDLLEDETINLLDAGSMEASLAFPRGPSSRYMLSLAGIDFKGHHAFFYLVHENYGNTLNPRDLYSSDALVSVSIPTSGSQKVTLKRALPEELNSNLFDNDTSNPPLKNSRVLSSKEQRLWHRLRNQDTSQTLLLEWEQFTKGYEDSPLYPYALFTLSLQYHRAFSDADMTEDEIKEWRDKTLETARRLETFTMAPSYLRAMARFTYKEVYNGQPIKFDQNHLN